MTQQSIFGNSTTAPTPRPKKTTNQSNNQPKVFLTDILEGSAYTNQILAIEEIQQHTTKTGNPYYRLRLQDRTGEVAGKIWQDKFNLCPGVEKIKRGDVVQADFEVQSFNNKFQLVVTKMKVTNDYDVTDLMQSTDKNLTEMWQRILNLIKSLTDQNIKTLIENIYLDPAISSQIKACPGGLSVHHDFVGGLIEHLLEMAELAEVVVKQYPRANRDLVMAGVLLHDIGKIREMNRQNAIFAFTTQGSLHGHLVMGVQMLLEYLPKKFPLNIKDHLLHIILAHNSHREFGSPVVPASLEAMIVAKIDDVSAKVRTIDKALANKTPDATGLSEYNKYIGTRVYHGVSQTKEEPE